MGKKTTSKPREEKPFTPEPPQTMVPGKPEKNKTENKDSQKKDDKREPDTYKKIKKEKEAKPRLLGESETEITDETTI